jgi:pyrroline-5-carboxylate reductase
MTDVLLLGCGRMGSAMLAGWLASGTVHRVAVIDPNATPVDDPRVIRLDPADPLRDFHPAVIVLAVKPQMMDAALPACRPFTGGAVVLSIAAGRTMAGLASRLGERTALVRAMPNTPAAIGRGITVAVASPLVTPSQRALCHTLLAAVGAVEWVEDEALLDPVTALSGSGPAYVFLLIEAMTAAGLKAGLPAALAATLARATVAGAGELARLSPESPEKLRRDVTSPNGTTQAALDVLMAADGLEPLLARAVAAATRRSRELAG